MRGKGLFFLTAFVVLAVAGVFLLAATKDSGDGMVCRNTGKNHLVSISDGQMRPEQTTGAYCDTLTIRNEDAVTREIGFGEHDHHTAYDGIKERILTKGESFTVTLSKKGTFHFHDHFHDETHGDFIVR